ncbi:hypothetical protein [Sciscionella marina]|uniref:hypothetical protein n=1 Tax=Sciscionella marina TaxID=508770 RepID=UPI00035C2AC7|nr:hypothetical protein [Sciscionella marina]
MTAQDGHRLGGADPKPQAQQAPPGQPPGGAPLPHASGKKLYVDPAEAGQALAYLDQAVSKLQESYDHSSALDHIQKPGNENPSDGFAKVASDVGKQKRAEILQDINGLRAMYQELKATLDNHHETEHANADNLRRMQR